MQEWKIFRGSDTPHDGIERLPPPPPWRDFERPSNRGSTFRAPLCAVEAVNAALYLRRPLLVTGPPGSGKSSLAYAVAWELRLGRVLHWAINSRSTLSEGLYHYDGLARLRDANLERADRSGPDQKNGPPAQQDIGRYLRLGSLGTALLPNSRPRVLLIDEIDKSDLDLPSDLLHVFEEGTYEIPELLRAAETSPEVAVLPSDGDQEDDRVVIKGGRVRCKAFPFVVLTSNGERELPPPFLRRCLRLDIPAPDVEALRHIVQAHLQGVDLSQLDDLVTGFVKRRESGHVLAMDQLLNAVFLVVHGKLPEGEERQVVLDVLLRELGRG